MPDIASALKQEIARLARKELRSETETLKKASSNYRSELVAMKRRIDQLERQVQRLSKGSDKPERQSEEEDSGSYRWRPAGFAKHRARLGLTAAQCGQLLGVSSLTVYKWEKGEARPRASYLPAIAALRGMGKREVAKRIAEAPEVADKA